MYCAHYCIRCGCCCGDVFVQPKIKEPKRYLSIVVQLSGINDDYYYYYVY